MGRDVLREDPYPDNNHQHTTTTTYIVNGGRPAPLCQHYVSAQSGKMWHLEEKSTGRPIVTICFTELIFEFDEDFGCGRIQCPWSFRWAQTTGRSRDWLASGKILRGRFSIHLSLNVRMLFFLLLISSLFAFKKIHPWFWPQKTIFLYFVLEDLCVGIITTFLWSQKCERIWVVKIIEGLSSHDFGLHNGVLVPSDVYLTQGWKDSQQFNFAFPPPTLRKSAFLVSALSCLCCSDKRQDTWNGVFSMWLAQNLSKQGVEIDSVV